MDRGEDRDDWFGGAEPEDVGTTEHGLDDAEDWLQELPPSSPRRPAVDRRLVVVAVVAVGLLIAVLAAAGVFSSSSKPPALTTTSTPAITTSSNPATTTTPAVPAPTTPLKLNDTGAQVKVLQRALASLGFYTGKVDGGFGPATQAAVEKFQTSVGLKADGVVGTKTLSALARRLSGG